MPRGRSWTQEEVSRLLGLVEGSGEAALLMGSTSRPNQALWQEISRGLGAAGYERTVAQCRSKWKALKQAFHSERETRRKDGCHSPSLSPYYQAMKSIWKAGGRPTFGERRMSGLVKLPFRKHRSAPADHSSSSPESSEHDVDKDTPGMLFSSLLQCAKDQPENSSSGDRVAGVSPPPLAMPSSHTFSKQERAQQKPGSSVSGLLQSVHHLLEQILEMSRQQQALLEGLASNTVSYLQLLSRSLVQMGETLHQILLQPPTHVSHYAPLVPLFEGDSGVPCSPGTHHTSLDDEEDPQMAPATGYTPS